MSAARAGTRTVLVLVLLALVGVAGAEVALRARGWSERRPRPPFEELALRTLPPADAVGTEFRYDPVRYYTLAPGRRASPEHLGRYARGDWPFRGRPPAPAPEGLLHVAVVGDSSVFGHGVTNAESLPWRIQVHLARLGLGYDRCVVSNFGVNGYTTVQVRLLVREVLARHAPDAVVLRAAGWNDQGPSYGIDDVAMLLRPEPAAWRRLLPALGNAWEALRREPLVLPEVAPGEVEEAWEEGAPLFGTKVPAEEVRVQMEAAIASCQEAGVPVVVVVPGHPRSTTERWPRTLADRESVRRAARARGATVVDGPAVYAATGLADERLHLDFGHPTPEGHDAVGRAVAEALLPLLPPSHGGRPADAGGLRLAGWSPRTVPALGDVRLEVEVEGLGPDEPVVVVVGGAPLVDLERPAGGRLSGLLMANAAGAQALVVQAARGCVAAEAAVRIEAPSIEPGPLAAGPPGAAGGPALVVRSRAGDRVELFWSDARRAEPLWWEAGRIWLGGTPRGPLRPEEPCGPDGTLALRLPPEAGELPEVWVQARVGPGVPGGEGGLWERASIASEPLRLVPRGATERGGH